MKTGGKLEESLQNSTQKNMAKWENYRKVDKKRIMTVFQTVKISFPQEFYR